MAIIDIMLAAFTALSAAVVCNAGHENLKRQAHKTRQTITRTVSTS
jgi:hypothetical protein